ncbi:glycoside hydrolase family 3 C-terminal domain-containing protein [Polaribacter sp. R2A056_3_33]|uniref:glycoside hydrolase family 3 N-terminal domain-containing protein n=1 Tax=Polaribacter sp. R2A056_3_33 TaxID=2745563 RepID=UPI001C76FC46|nr:glycoside hydrolase family 3 N-terminal domain-containing protein [Polaribacter sp. R2A056_3_33]QXP70434.1 glycoside hydrolase family 3 C-terminal domain-containing protein [Polaribacter sp. R2A056_3_33]
MKKTFLLLLLLVTTISCKENKKLSSAEDTTDEAKIEVLLSKMSLEEKIGQTNLRGMHSTENELPEKLISAVKKGEVGAFLNIMNLDYVDELQRIAVEESSNGIPLIFGRDVIHGFKTIFPIPLGLAATWNTQIVEKSSEIAAFEATSSGIRWTFAPMLDIARDSRWGRIAESPGEDPYLATVLGAAYIKGFQGNNLSNPYRIAASAKHYIAYGAAIGGRDYNTVNLSEPLLRNIYLPPFKAAINAGAATVMSSFNEINGIPATGHEFLLKDVLRGELQFDGFVVSDWDSVTEMIAHGFASDEKHAAELAAKAGLDMEMNSEAYESHLKELIEEEKVTIEELDEFVRNILRIKFRLGLFENPHRNKEHTGNLYAESHLEEAKKAAIESTVLLKNKNSILPLSEKTNIAIIGPLANAPHEQLGTWAFDGEKEHTNTPLDAYKKANANFTFANGLGHSRDVSTEGFKEAINNAEKSDIILFFGGEEAILSGEAHSRANINLPGAQEELINELAKTGKPIVLVIMAGRPITITNIIDKIDAVLMAWHPGTMGGEALYEIVHGIKSPEGRLPVSWPKTAGQLPYFYNHKNTGRPADSINFIPMDKIPIAAWQSSLGNDSHYLDVGFTPHFPFGYGLTYTTFKYADISISKEVINFNEDLEVKVSITNTGKNDGKEIAQLYIQDVVGSITRPVKELKRFEHVFLKSGETKEVTFKISAKDLEFVNHKMIKAAEEGVFNIWVGPNASEGLKTSFSLKK